MKAAPEQGAIRELLRQAVEAEVAALLICHADKLTDDGASGRCAWASERQIAA